MVASVSRHDDPAKRLDESEDGGCPRVQRDGPVPTFCPQTVEIPCYFVLSK